MHPMTYSYALLLCVIIQCILKAAPTPRVVVTFRNASLNEDVIVPDNTTIVKQYGRRLVLRIMDGMEEGIQEALGGEESVERVESDVLASAYELVNNSDYVSVNYTETSAILWNSPLLSISSGWNLNESEPYGLHIKSIRSFTNGRGATMAIVDSGVAEIAKELFSPAGGYDFISSSDYSNKPNQARNPDYTDPGDQGPSCPTPSWHGTKVASVATAIAPGATLTVMRALGQCGVGFSSDIADAIVWAAGGQINGLGTNPFPASIISLSLAGRSPCPTYLQSAVNQARSLGATVIAAAGNAAQNVSFYFPANCRGVITVGSSTRRGTVAPYSNWGAGVMFSAPGGGDASDAIQVLSVSADGSALVPSLALGTSFAVPHVAGFGALLRAGGMGIESSGEFIPFSDNYCILNPKMCSLKGILSSWKAVQPVGIWTNSSVSLPISNWFNNDGKSNSTRAVSAGTCTTVRVDETAASRYSGYNNPVWNQISTFRCPAGCFITGIFTGNVGELIKRLAFECSDGGGESTQFGEPGTGFWWRNGLGFSRVYACADDEPGDYWLWGLTAYDSNNNQVGTLGKQSGCDEDVDFPCGKDASNHQNLLTGMAIIGKNNYGITQIKPICASIQCPANYYMASNSLTCYNCAACTVGQYSSGCGGYSSGSCLPCGTDCPDMQYRAGCSGTSPGSCAFCGGCSAGQKFGGCPGGGLSDTHSCSSCESGKYGSGGRSRACTDCGVGKYNSREGAPDSSWCVPCPPGTYGPNTGARGGDQCQKCPAGKLQTSTGATSRDSCVDCAVGTFGPEPGTGYVCVGCPWGTYNDDLGQLECKSCLAGTYMSANGATVCSVCGVGKYNSFTASTSASACLLCGEGKFNTMEGGANSFACAPCPLGSYGLTQGATLCTGCTSGTFTPTVGWNKPCQACAAGKYNPDSGGGSAASCRDCDVGKYSSAESSSICTSCVPGTFANSAGNTMCDTCSSTSYADKSGSVICRECPVLTTCATGTESICIQDFGSRCSSCSPIYACEYQSSKCFSNGIPSCLCRPGFEMRNNVCAACVAGKFKSTLSTAACSNFATPVCARGYLLQAGSAISDAVCVPCPALPGNAAQATNGCDWGCAAGFDNNAP